MKSRLFIVRVLFIGMSEISPGKEPLTTEIERPLAS
jgi:hypothetical protein